MYNILEIIHYVMGRTRNVFSVASRDEKEQQRKIEFKILTEPIRVFETANFVASFSSLVSTSIWLLEYQIKH